MLGAEDQGIAHPPVFKIFDLAQIAVGFRDERRPARCLPMSALGQRRTLPMKPARRHDERGDRFSGRRRVCPLVPVTLASNRRRSPARRSAIFAHCPEEKQWARQRPSVLPRRQTADYLKAPGHLLTVSPILPRQITPAIICDPSSAALMRLPTDGAPVRRAAASSSKRKTGAGSSTVSGSFSDLRLLRAVAPAIAAPRDMMARFSSASSFSKVVFEQRNPIAL